MADSLSRQSFQPYSVILREGESGDRAYLIESGRVEVSALRAGRPVRLAVLGKHDVFGEMALVDETVRSATVTALEETRVVVIEGDRFRDEIDRAQPLIQMFVRLLVERLRTTGGRVLSQGGLDAEPPSPGPSPAREATAVSAELAVSALRLEHDLRQALTRDELEMHYQPIVELEGGEIVGFEALMRWRRGSQGMVHPNDFIGLAESSGLIVPIGMFAVRQACATLKELEASGLTNGARLFMGVNVSPRQLADPNLYPELRAAIDETGIDPTRIHLEITETLLMEDPDRAIAALGRIKDLGIDISIDDFGTGYSSLGYLSRFPIDTLKIDRSFVVSLESNPASQQIVRAITRLAHSLELTLVAEGIEEPAQRDFLNELGCENGQGYLFSKPVPASRLPALLRARPRRAHQA